MEITKQKMIEVCENNGFGMVANSSPGVEEIMLNFLKIGEAIWLCDNIYVLEISSEFEDLFM